MDKDTRNAIERATQRARALLVDDFASQLEGTFDVLRSGAIAETGGAHLSAREEFQREKIVAAIEHKRAFGMPPPDAVADYVRDAAFTTLNRFVALKMLEARELVPECISKGEQSSGYREFCGLAPGVALLPDSAGYRLYIESIFDELSTEVKVLFDRRDPASVLWPKRATFDGLFGILNAQELAGVWAEDETIGWVYQYFNGQDERRKMRDESQAPRNSREFAVRNQFFTPRYVVQFLTDNALGRIWYEMHGGKTRLAERCEYLVRRPNDTWEPRPKKDPRDLRILDPACGSGHFLLYCFDLLLVIYEEAWADADPPTSEATVHNLKHDYPEIGDLRAFLPELILRHNLHGVDIDPRCAQIAQLALWMRAQRAFRDFGIARTERPVIRRANFVIAEPMPGEKELLAEFLRELKEDRLEGLLRRALDIPPERTVKATKAMADSLAELVATVWDSMKLAGELGVLLKIERDLAQAIEKGRAEWEDRLPLFRIAEYGLGGVSKEALVRAVPGAQDDFWTKAEKLVFQALADYAAAASGTDAARRRLFSEDAAQGFALADLVTRRFDVALMNPPFGALPPQASRYGRNVYGGGRPDAYRYMFFRCRELLVNGGLLGALSSRTFHSLEQFAPMRRALLVGDFRLHVLADLGAGVLDGATVETSAYVAAKDTCGITDRAEFFQLSDADDKAQTLLDCAIKEEGNKRTYRVQLRDLAALPGGVLAYWLPLPWAHLFRSNPPLDSQNYVPGLLEVNSESHERIAHVAQGLISGDTTRFTRLEWEVSHHIGSRDWVRMLKGGEYSPYFSAEPWLIRWRDQGREMKAYAEQNYGGASRTIKSEAQFFRPGLSFPNVSSVGFNVRLIGDDCVLTNTGYGIIPDNINFSLPLAAYLNSRAIAVLCEALHPGRKFDVGPVSSLPVPLNVLENEQLRHLAKTSFDVRVDLSSDDGRLWALEWRRAQSPTAAIQKFQKRFVDRYLQAANAQDKINTLVFQVLSLPSSAVEFASHIVASRRRRGESERTDIVVGLQPERANDELLNNSVPSTKTLITQYIILRLHQGLDVIGVCVDDPGHQHDVVRYLQNALLADWPSIDGDKLLAEIEFLLSRDVRSWLRNEAFERILRLDTISPRRAPTLWSIRPVAKMRGFTRAT